ncbi:PTS sugar transporter subunit IIC [Pediococcus ethanolidurans]|uniref:Permease IIC component n=1 Tax=Pediococcus ethanolidurans TaxID=319653 RepID=A0A0R2K1W5_9LACO|nr:PTS transporter subunit EIIC [Pediococcus ethanolidurans]KRN83582.1 pts family oligomeric beta-glucoside porter component iic [Pediococcus ethanolidurans]GEN94063.1 permease IIC component [Pediococcus ethanolidurans]SER03706.1 PTS system, cellobiose-specific IIC component [Pediococcus ethanolidurans]
MKEKVQGFFDRITPTLNKIAANKYLLTIMKSMMATLGLTIIGSMSVLLVVFPIKAVPDFINKIGLTPILNLTDTITVGCLAVYIVFLMAKNLVPHFISGDDGTMAGIIALMNFLILTPLKMVTEKSASLSTIPTTWLGTQGIFSAMLVGLISARVYVYIKQHGWTIKMPESVPPMVSEAFEALIPLLVEGVIFILISWLFTFTSYGCLHQAIYSLIQIPLKHVGGSVLAMIFISILQQILWFFGIHGTNVLLPLVTPIWLSMDMEDLQAIKAGKEIPNIIGLGFFNIITWSGLALGLVLLMIFAKSQQYKKLGRLAVVPAFFGITEPVIFGTPLVLNFDLAIPFIFNNTIAIIISYTLIKIGIVAKFIGAQAVFGLPLGFHAAVEGSASIIILQILIQLVLSPILWWPWFRRVDRKAYALEQKSEVKK